MANAESLLIQAQAKGLIEDEDWQMSNDNQFFMLNHHDERGVVEYEAAEVEAVLAGLKVKPKATIRIVSWTLEVHVPATYEDEDWPMEKQEAVEVAAEEARALYENLCQRVDPNVEVVLHG